MRGTTRLLRLFVLFVLVWAQMPARVLASAFASKQTPCKMRCCVSVLQPSKPRVSRCSSCPAQSVVSSSKAGETIAAPDSCRCKVSSHPAPSQGNQFIAIATTSPFQSELGDAALPSAPLLLLPECLAIEMPGFQIIDSGPPPSAHHRVFLGRAPPVFGQN